MTPVHRIYLIPGMFGFARLAGYDYFGHLQRGVTAELERAGVAHTVEVVSTPPTASIRRRARFVADRVARTSNDEDLVHLIGHSTGGLDARLLAAPFVQLEMPRQKLAWRKQLRTVVTLNTPHHGTPLAQFFATVSGTRLLYALSLLTVTTLTFGGVPLTALSTLVAAAGNVDKAVGLDIRLLDRTTELLLRFIGERGREEVRAWLEGIRLDQGGIIQISPESMDLFNAAVEDAPEVRYGCVAAAAPPPRPMRFVQSVRSPYAALSAAIYSTLYTVASRPHRHYRYPLPGDETKRALEDWIGRPVSERINDGVVPTLSMLWGELLWSGRADHLDVVGHFADDVRPPVHTDWLACGAHFRRPQFGQLVRKVVGFLLGDGTSDG